MVVLEELDHAKKGLTDVARNVRQVSRFLDELIRGVNQQSLNDGLALSMLDYGNQGNEPKSMGRLYFQTSEMTALLPESMPGNTADNSILRVMLALTVKLPTLHIILVSKDINMRIKAATLNVMAEDYHNDQTLDDIDLLYNGATCLDSDFWDEHGSCMESWQEKDRTFYRLHDPLVAEWYPNQYVYIDDDSNFEAIVRQREGDIAILELARDYRSKHNNVWGITAKNREQNFALNVLLDPDIDFVTLLGTAGTGKTLIALAAGLAMTLEKKLYTEIVMTRETVPIGEDIGFLPGTEEEKMAPWMGALEDNLDVLNHTDDEAGEWGRAATRDLIRSRIKVKSLNFMRGRTFLNKFVIIDEAQNLTPKQMKTLITRAGPGTKVVCLGNISQIDTPYLTEGSSGLTYVVDRMKGWPHGGHVTLMRGERSRLADFAAESL